MRGNPKTITGPYPENRLAVLFDRETKTVLKLLYLSARFGVFQFSRGTWSILSEKDRIKFADSHYFHLDFSRFTELVEMFSYEDLNSLIVSTEDLSDFEVVYEFEEPFWGFDTSQDEPFQLRKFSEILDFADCFPNITEVFNEPTGLNRASDWAAHMQQDSIAVSWIQGYQDQIRKIRIEHAASPNNQRLFWADQLPALNSFVQRVVEMTEPLYYVDPYDKTPDWANEGYTPNYLERELILEYLSGGMALTTDELLSQCAFFIDKHIAQVPVITSPIPTPKVQP